MIKGLYKKNNYTPLNEYLKLLCYKVHSTVSGLHCTYNNLFSDVVKLEEFRQSVSMYF